MKRHATKRTLLTLTLVLAASATAFAQKASGLELRYDDMFVGPVRTVRVETASYVKRDGELVEGPRRLSFTNSYSEDGKRREWEYYAADGALRDRSVIVYNDGGRVVEQYSYRGSGRLNAKSISKPDEGETLNYDGDGRLRSRSVIVIREDGSREVNLYNADGTLKKRLVVKSGDWGMNAKYYDVNSRLLAEDDSRYGEGGKQVIEEQRYDANGAPVNREVTNARYGPDGFESDVLKPDGAHVKTRGTWERDAHGNPVKRIEYIWDEAAGDYMPTTVTYYTVTYYR
jgi:antitoxin component YwqK of YwqJK toxin-antitoxin module